MRRLTNLTRRFVLPASVGVRQGLGYKQNAQNRQSERERPEPTALSLMLTAHFDVDIDYPNLRMDARAFAPLAASIMR